jgi:Biotin-lipoyl like
MFAPKMTKLSSRVAGAVVTVEVSDFQRVKAGALLVQIDLADYEAQVAEVRQASPPPRLRSTTSATGSNCNTPPLPRPRRSGYPRKRGRSKRSRNKTVKRIQPEAGTRQKLEQAGDTDRDFVGMMVPHRHRGADPIEADAALGSMDNRFLRLAKVAPRSHLAARRRYGNLRSCGCGSPLNFARQLPEGGPVL